MLRYLRAKVGFVNAVPKEVLLAWSKVDVKAPAGVEAFAGCFNLE